MVLIVLFLWFLVDVSGMVFLVPLVIFGGSGDFGRSLCVVLYIFVVMGG